MPSHIANAGALAAGLGLALWAGLAGAAERPGVAFTLGLGASVTPDYPGADSLSVGPTGRFSLQQVRLPDGSGFGRPDAQPLDPGFGVTGAFRYIGTRGPGAYPELAGLDRVGTSVELGLGLRHVAETWSVFGELRHGVIGHNAWTGTLGADAILRLGSQMTLTAGPRADFGDSRFTRTYFGVTPAEAAASAAAGTGFTPFRPDGGLVSVGAELGMRYSVDDDWALRGSVSYDRLRRGAARSPITSDVGSRDQWGAALVVTRRINLRF